VLPAALFDALLVRPSRRTFDAALAAADEVLSLGALLWVRALPAAFLEFAPVDELFNTFAALFATLGLVPFFIYLL